jgi:hypothetical protein
LAISPRVRQAVARSFPADQHAAILELLAEYQSNERPRVQLAILALANGDEKRLRTFLREAKLDYRDVLLWAEYPDEGGRIRTRQEMAKRYRGLGVDVPPDLRGPG